MTGQDQLDVLIALYLIPDLARQDFDGFVTRKELKAGLEKASAGLAGS